jgi:hypothetical protein
MDETYRMLGREHQADLDREAVRRSLATQAAPRPRQPFSLLRRLTSAAPALVRRVRTAQTT